MAQDTRAQLEKALLELSAQKPLDHITVSELTAAAGVSRMTFYYHFKDIYDLLTWICIHRMQDVFSNAGSNVAWQQGILNILKTVQEYGNFTVSVYHCIRRDRIEDFLRGLIHEAVLRDISTYCSGRLEQKELDTAVLFYECGVIGMLLDWIGRGMEETPEELAGTISRLLTGTLEHMVSNVQAAKK